MLLVPGMMFTIEPMINMGSYEIYVDDSDGWSVYTENDLLCTVGDYGARDREWI